MKSTIREVVKPDVPTGQLKNTGGVSVSYDSLLVLALPADKFIVVIAAAWNDAQSRSGQSDDTRRLAAATSRAMDFWFNRDITNLACLDRGGTVQCPCNNASDTTFW